MCNSFVFFLSFVNYMLVESLIHFILLVCIFIQRIHYTYYLQVVYTLLYYILLFFTIQHKLQYGQRLSADVIKRTFLSHIFKTINVQTYQISEIRLYVLVSVLKMIVVLVDQGGRRVPCICSYVYIMYNVSTLQIGKRWSMDEINGVFLYFSLELSWL